MGGGSGVHVRCRVARIAPQNHRCPQDDWRPGGTDGSGSRVGVRRCRSRNSRSIKFARQRPRLEPSAVDPDRDARHSDAGKRRTTRRIRPVLTPRHLHQLARGDPGRSPERGRLGVLGGGGHVNYRHPCPNARTGRTCLGLRHLRDLATRTTHARGVRRKRSRTRRRDRGDRSGLRWRSVHDSRVRHETPLQPLEHTPTS